MPLQKTHENPWSPFRTSPNPEQQHYSTRPCTSDGNAPFILCLQHIWQTQASESQRADAEKLTAGNTITERPMAGAVESQHSGFSSDVVRFCMTIAELRTSITIMRHTNAVDVLSHSTTTR
jgi:hypothetical protein